MHYTISRRVNFLTILIGSAFLSLNSCKKDLSVDHLVDMQLASQVFNTDVSANTAIAGIYRTFRERVFGQYSTSILTGLTGDELYNFTPSPTIFDDFKNNNLNSSTGFMSWAGLFNCIYQANAAIEGIGSSAGMTSPAKDQLRGEAMFLRALSYFYLVNLYGDVPLLLTTNVSANAAAARTATADVYAQIVSDLTKAQTLLGDGYTYNNGEKVRANKWAATALLARVQLYMGNWQEAESQATAILSSGKYTLQPTTTGVFIKNNNEAILQLINNTTEFVFETSYFIFTSVPNIVATSSLVNSFEANDQRKTKWMASRTYSGTLYYYPFKYTSTTSPTTEYFMLLRLAEQYLIRAEARAQQSSVSNAVSDLNVIRNRAGLPSITGTISQDSCLNAIFHERQVELFAECGHRWFDMKRTGKINPIMTAQKPTFWQTTDALWPIPLSDIQRNPNLVQNPGY